MSKDKKEVIRKPNPSQRQNIHLATYQRIVEFLKQQKQPVFKSEIHKLLGIDYNSVNFALEGLFRDDLIEADEENKIQWRNK